MKFTPEQIETIIGMIKRATALVRMHANNETFCIPEGYEATGEIRIPNLEAGELCLYYHVYANKMRISDPKEYVSTPQIIIRKIKKYEWATDNKPRVPGIGDIIRDAVNAEMVEINSENINKYTNRGSLPRLCYRRIEVE